MANNTPPITDRLINDRNSPIASTVLPGGGGTGAGVGVAVEVGVGVGGTGVSVGVGVGVIVGVGLGFGVGVGVGRSIPTSTGPFSGIVRIRRIARGGNLPSSTPIQLKVGCGHAIHCGCRQPGGF